MRISRVAIPICLAMVASMAAYGDVILSNLAQSPFGTDSGLDAGAESFIVGDTTETLTDVTLELLGTGGSVDVSLFNDNSSGLPGSSLLNLGDLTPSGSGYADYTVTGTYTLEADTTYWVVVDYLGTPSWGFTLGTGFTGTGTLGDFANSDNGGASWNGPFPPEQGPYLLEVDGSPITPEPSALVLTAIGLGALLLVKRAVGFALPVSSRSRRAVRP